MHTETELLPRVAEVVAERIGIETPEPAADLLEAGIIDSLALVTLIVALEDTFGVELPLDDFDIERFRSVAAMTDLLVSAGA